MRLAPECYRINLRKATCINKPLLIVFIDTSQLEEHRVQYVQYIRWM
jgi:hypothetical protein